MKVVAALFTILVFSSASAFAFDADLDAVTDVEIEFESELEPALDAPKMSCQVQIRCPKEGLVTCTARGRKVKCDKGAGWVRCASRTGSKVSVSQYKCNQ